MLRKFIFLYLLFFTFSYGAKAEFELPHEYQLRLKVAKTDSAKALVYYDACKLFKEKDDYVTEIYWRKKAIDAADGYSALAIMQATCYDRLAEIAMKEKPNDPEVVEYLHNAVKKYKSVNQYNTYLQVAIAYLRLATILENMEEHKQAELYTDSAKLSLPYLENGKEKGMLYDRIAVFYFNIKKFENSLLYADSAIKLGQKYKIADAMLRGWRQKINVYIAQKRGKDILRLSDSVFRHRDDVDHQSGIEALCYDLNHRAKGYMFVNNTDSAYYYFKRSLEFAYTISHKKWIVINFDDMGQMAFTKKDYNTAEKYWLSELEVSEKEHFNNDILKSYKQLSLLYTSTGKHERANFYLYKYLHLKDSLSPPIKFSYLASAMLKKQIETHKELNTQLQKNNKEQEKKLIVEGQRTTNLIILVTVFLIFILFGAWQYVKINQHRKKIAESKQHIEQQNQEIATVNEELRANNEHLMQLIDERNDLLAVVSHDLKAPLNRALGLTQLLASDNKNFNEDQKKLFGLLIEELEHERKLIADILDAEMLDHELKSISLEKANVCELLNECVNSFVPIAAKKQININFFEKDRAYYLNLNAIYFKRIVDNLLSNAIKFSHRDTTITVSVKSIHGKVYIYIQDQGLGFSDEDKKNLFKRYHKLSSLPTEGESSTGLGLSIVRKLVEAMKGTIELKSEKNAGSQFSLTFFEAV